MLNNVNANTNKISWSKKNTSSVKSLNKIIELPKNSNFKTQSPKVPSKTIRVNPQTFKLTDDEKRFLEGYKTITIEGIVINLTTTKLYLLYKSYLAYKKSRTYTIQNNTKRFTKLTWDQYLKTHLTRSTVKKFKAFLNRELGLNFNELSITQINTLFNSKAFKNYSWRRRKGSWSNGKPHDYEKTGTEIRKSSTLISKNNNNNYTLTKSAVWK